MSDPPTPVVDCHGPPRGTAGYAEAADALAVQYEEVTFDEVHRDVLEFVPTGPGRILDVGAGTGRDAAALAARGHTADALPHLALRRHPGPFDAVFVTAVWMHLDAEERRHAMGRIAALLVTGGRFFVNLRHGPVPAGRHMFDVSAAETVELGRALGLRTVHRGERPDLHGRDNVRWSSLVLQADGINSST